MRLVPAAIVFHFRLEDVSTLEWRTVTHFHFNGWPDYGVPKDLHNLVGFIENVRSVLLTKNTNCPIMVHCSAGVGRSGTYIALDTLIQVKLLQKEI